MADKDRRRIRKKKDQESKEDTLVREKPGQKDLKDDFGETKFINFDDEKGQTRFVREEDRDDKTKFIDLDYEDNDETKFIDVDKGKETKWVNLEEEGESDEKDGEEEFSRKKKRPASLDAFKGNRSGRREKRKEETEDNRRDKKAGGKKKNDKRSKGPIRLRNTVIFFLVVAAVLAIYLNINGSNTVTSLYLDINPSFAIEVTDRDKVKDIKALNLDGQRVLEGYSYKDKSYEEATEDLIDMSMEENFLDDSGLILLSGKSDNNSDRKLMSLAKNLAAQNPDISILARQVDREVEVDTGLESLKNDVCQGENRDPSKVKDMDLEAFIEYMLDENIDIEKYCRVFGKKLDDKDETEETETETRTETEEKREESPVLTDPLLTETETETEDKGETETEDDGKNRDDSNSEISTEAKENDSSNNRDKGSSDTEDSPDTESGSSETNTERSPKQSTDSMSENGNSE